MSIARTLASALAVLIATVVPVTAGTLEARAAALNLVPLDGAAPPPLALERLADGKVVALSSLRGRPVLVYFWATW